MCYDEQRVFKKAGIHMTYLYLLLAILSSATIAIDGRLYKDKHRERPNVSGL